VGGLYLRCGFSGVVGVRTDRSGEGGGKKVPSLSLKRRREPSFEENDLFSSLDHLRGRRAISGKENEGL